MPFAGVDHAWLVRVGRRRLPLLGQPASHPNVVELSLSEQYFFVHYNDLLADLAGEIGRIASFLNIEVPGEALPALLEAVSLASM
jgi:hypothetical protein